MSAALILLILSGAVRWTTSHVVYSKDPQKFVAARLSHDEWRPVRDTPGSYGRRDHGPYLRYTALHQKGQNFGFPKKAVSHSHQQHYPLQQQGEHSESVEIFSPAPPSILGSFSVFGHATVKAREPASHIVKKSPRPSYPVDYHFDSRQKVNGYDLGVSRLQNTGSGSSYPSYELPQSRPQRINDYHEQTGSHYYEQTLRSPTKVSPFNPLTQSTSLTANTHYFNSQPHSFHPSDVDNSYSTARKPTGVRTTLSPYRLSTYTTPSSIDQYRTSLNGYDNPESSSYYSSGNSYQISSNDDQHSYIHRNPFGDIHLNTRRPQSSLKPVFDDKEPAKDLYDQYSHLSRPFQSSTSFATAFPTTKNTHQPSYATLYPTADPTLGVKFSDVAQPFQVTNGYHSSQRLKPDYIVTQAPYLSEDEFPITSPTVVEKKKPAPNRSHQRNKNRYNDYNSRPSHVQVTSYQGYLHNDGAQHFLPTPSPESHSYNTEPNNNEEPTVTPPEAVSDYNIVSTVYNNDQEYEQVTEYPATTISPAVTTVLETTTTSKPRTTNKARRRPTRPTHSSSNKMKNHKTEEYEGSTTVDYYTKLQRRRKPINKFREGSEYKRLRPTSTTKMPYTNFDSTEPFEYTTIKPEETFKSNYGEEQNQMSQDTEETVELDSHKTSNRGETFPINEILHPENESQKGHYTVTSSDGLRTTPAPQTGGTPKPSVQASAGSATAENSSSTLSSRLRNKYGNNRPRFSVKDYRERLHRGTSTESTLATESTSASNERGKYENGESVRVMHRVRSTTPSSRTTSESSTVSSFEGSSNDSKHRKYKPRVGPSRTFYKTSTTGQPEISESTTTTERVNTFKPSTNRYKPGTGKYYSRYRTSTIPPKEVDDSPATTTSRITVRPKGVFSAKRRPHPLMKTKYENESTEENTPKMTENEVFPDIITKKMDEGISSTTSSSEEMIEDVQVQEEPSVKSSPPSMMSESQESMKVADLTSSSSNDFHSTSIYKTITVASRKNRPRITFTTDEPILPLEAFFKHSEK